MLTNKDKEELHEILRELLVVQSDIEDSKKNLEKLLDRAKKLYKELNEKLNAD